MNPSSADTSPIVTALAAEQRRFLRLALLVRTGALALLAAWFAADAALSGAHQYVDTMLALLLAATGGFEALAIGRARPGARLVPVLGTLADAAIVTAALVAPNPFLAEQYAPALVLKGSAVLYYLPFVAFRTLSFDARLVLTAGVATCAGWAVVLGVAALDPGVTIGLPVAPAGDFSAVVAGFLDPGAVNLAKWLAEALLIALVSAGLAVAAAQSRRLSIRQAEAQRARANLSRYFSPLVVEKLASRDRALTDIRTQPAAVLFADVAGFTSLAEALAPGDVMDLLRAHHAMIEDAVFARHGSLEKFIGDAALACFGVPDAGPHDASDAMEAARDMLHRLDAMNGQRAARGEERLRIGIGLHFGEVAVGDIGSARSMAFATVGDAVNVASRLQSLTRELDVPIVASGAYVARLAEEKANTSDFTSFGHQALRGRSAQIEVFGLSDRIDPVTP